MNWLNDNEFTCRPLLIVEDHVYHISQLLRTIQSSCKELASNLTVVCLDRAGPDTDAAVQEWLGQFVNLQVAARVSELSHFDGCEHRLLPLDPDVFSNSNCYCKQIARLLRKRGLLIQDIELETLEFVPRDRWWESTMLASTVRGIVGDRAPHCAFISNKRGYEATFGAELLAAGHDPRDVLNKLDLQRSVLPFLNNYMDKHFPWMLRWDDASLAGSGPCECYVACDSGECSEVESELDVVLWPVKDDTCMVGGRVFDSQKRSQFQLPVDGNEFQTWRALVSAKLDGRDGVEVAALGARVAPAGALRAEATNAAARHIHSLRKRLANPQDILTVQGHYRLCEKLKVGLAENRLASGR